MQWPFFFSSLRVPVHLHIGVHKTGSTTLQDILLANRARLVEAGVAYPSLGEVRKPLRQAIDGKAKKARRLFDLTVREVPACRRILLSEENICGTASHLGRREGLIYPDLGERLHVVREQVIRRAPVKVFLCIRSLDGFLPALWCEFIRFRPFQTFETFLSRVDIETVSWRPVLEAVINATGKDNTVVWTFDRFVRDPAAIAALVAGVERDFLGKVDTHSYPSPSERAVAELVELSRSRPAEEIPAMVREVEERFPRPQYLPFRPFPSHVAEELRSRFRDDVAWLRNAFPHVTVLD